MLLALTKATGTTLAKFRDEICQFGLFYKKYRNYLMKFNLKGGFETPVQF